MKVVISVSGRYHNFDMARELEKRGALEAIFTGYPMFKLKNEAAIGPRIRSFPWFQTPNMFLRRLPIPTWGKRQLTWSASEALDRYVARHLPSCDAFIGLSQNGLYTGRVAKERGAVYVCDRGSTHIEFQDQTMREEYAKYGLTFEGVDPRVIKKELAEYELADAIFLPSRYTMQSFVDRGIAESKLCYAPYGVELSRFSPTDKPDEQHFDVLFVGRVSVRKGMRYLIEAFKNLNHPHKRLTLVGGIDEDIKPWLDRETAGLPVTLTGSLPQAELKHIMSRSHVMVLPSVEEGKALVLSQTMACGCPIIASDRTGAPDGMTDGVEGFVFPARDVEALTARLQAMADDPALRDRMSKASLERVVKAGGWHEYGEAVYGHLQRLTSHNGIESENSRAPAR